MIFILISIISLIGLLSYYIIFSRIKISSFDSKISSFNEPISIIICAKDELHNLKQFFSSWINQKYLNFELIIVNDESTDGSYEYLTELEHKHEKLKVIHVFKKDEKEKYLLELKGKRYALRKGILAAKNNYVLLTDADCKPVSLNWAKEMVKAFSNTETEIVLGYSPYKKEKSFLNLLIQIETSLTAMHYFAFANIRKPYMGVGRNIAYKKELFKDKIFLNSNKTISGDDDLVVQQLANKNNTAYTTSLDSWVESIASTSFKSWFLQKKRHLSAGAFYDKKIMFFLNLFPILTLVFLISILFLISKNFFISLCLLSIFIGAIFLLINTSVLFSSKNKRKEF